MHRDGVQKNVIEGALVKGFKDLTIPHPLSLSFISNNQAWPQNIPLDGEETCPRFTHLKTASLESS